jgi:hypothetical protein
MDALTRTTREAEKPGRLQLAILEWQRELVAKREVRTEDKRRLEAA